MEELHYNKATFLLSVASLSQLPEDTGREVAFIGRSNSGKSSALNTLTNQKNLARTSKTPGRTQLINFFVLDESRRLVDLPGYGYAKVAEKIKKHWMKLLDDYLCLRKSLKGLVLLIDIRHPVSQLDRQIMTWAAEANLPIHILLTKADKFSYGARINAFNQRRKEMKEMQGEVTVQVFSALKKIGCDELKGQLNRWFAMEE